MCVCEPVGVGDGVLLPSVLSVGQHLQVGDVVGGALVGGLLGSALGRFVGSALQPTHPAHWPLTNVGYLKLRLTDESLATGMRKWPGPVGGRSSVDSTS